MRFRVEFSRKGSATKAGQAGRSFAVEVSARSEEDARTIAQHQAAREWRGHVFEIKKVRKI